MVYIFWTSKCSTIFPYLRDWYNTSPQFFSITTTIIPYLRDWYFPIQLPWWWLRLYFSLFEGLILFPPFPFTVLFCLFFPIWGIDTTKCTSKSHQNSPTIFPYLRDWYTTRIKHTSFFIFYFSLFEGLFTSSADRVKINRTVSIHSATYFVSLLYCHTC